MACCSCACFATAKGILWLCWGFNAFLCMVYLGLSMTTFYNVREATKLIAGGQDVDTYKNSLLASCMLPFLVVLFWLLFSFFVMLSKFFADAKLAYGIMLGTTIHSSWTLLLGGLVLQTSRSLMQQIRDVGYWSSKDYTTYEATFGFSYLLCGTNILLFFVLTFGRKYLGRSLDAPAAPATEAPAAPAATLNNPFIQLPGKGTQV